MGDLFKALSDSTNLASILVDDQAKALRFYAEVFGFVKKTEIPMGEHAWLTVVSPDLPDGVELVLEPSDHPAVGPFRAALVADGIPYTSFAVDDVETEHARLAAAGVRFTQPPTDMGPVTTAGQSLIAALTPADDDQAQTGGDDDRPDDCPQI